MFLKAEDVCQGQITHSSSFISASLNHTQLQSRAKSALVFFSRMPSRNCACFCSQPVGIFLIPWLGLPGTLQYLPNRVEDIPLDLNQLLWLCRWGEKSKSGADTYFQLLWALHSFFTSGLLSANTTWDHQRVPDRTEWIKRGLKLLRLSRNLLTRSYFVLNHLHRLFSVISTFPKIKSRLSVRSPIRPMVWITKIVCNCFTLR